MCRTDLPNSAGMGAVVPSPPGHTPRLAGVRHGVRGVGAPIHVAVAAGVLGPVALIPHRLSQRGAQGRGLPRNLPAEVPENFRKPSGNLPETFRKPSRQPSGIEPSGHLPATFPH